jgi:RecA/RadA recombinase
MEKINVYKITNIDEFSLLLPSLKNLCKEKTVKLLIIDSLMHHFRKELGNSEIQYRDILKKIKALLSEIKIMAKEYKFPVYLTSPISSSSREMYYSVKPILSNILNYYTDHWILLSVNDKVPDTNNTVVRNAVIVKSINLPEATIEFYITKEGVQDYC